MTNKHKTLRERIGEILGLETSPRGEVEFYLIRDENNTVIEGIPMGEEVTELCQLVSQTRKEALDKRDEEVVEEFELEIVKHSPLGREAVRMLKYLNSLPKHDKQK